MNYRIRGLDPEAFSRFYGLSDGQLAELGVIRCAVDACPGFPDRVEMRDMEAGETALLLNYEHLPVTSPYRSCHAIFVREGAERAYDREGVVPEVMKRRLIALRGFDDRGFMLEADVAEGDAIEPLIGRMFADPAVKYIHAHNARQGCFAGLIERA
ncbi:DUF1203 domain-containing protein [Algicella marina]|uniref:DUF1203 domain-containing protein n=1 Tax=Algicella marina TaxID=2683284 RepID=A0A6P1T2M1_9RHOB|nr:DUF1203 domain-containing protein [Algicella marina]QHQ35913.1 DUF1203 domain-containing protein [Algicella marina]